MFLLFSGDMFKPMYHEDVTKFQCKGTMDCLKTGLCHKKVEHGKYWQEAVLEQDEYKVLTWNDAHDREVACRHDLKAANTSGCASDNSLESF